MASTGINLMDYGAIQAQIIAGVRINVANMNADTLATWKKAVNDYMVNAQHIQELNVGRAVPLPMPTKPTPPMLAQIVDAPTTDQNHLPIAIQYVPAPGAPDPPPLPGPPPPNTVHVGVYDYGNHGVGGFWSSLPDDTYMGTSPVQAISADGVSGVFAKIPFFMGNGWYQRIA